MAVCHGGLPCTEPTVVTGLTLGPYLDLCHLMRGLPPSERGPGLLLPTSHMTSCRWARLGNSLHLPWEEREGPSAGPSVVLAVGGWGAGVSWLRPNRFPILALNLF